MVGKILTVVLVDTLTTEIAVTFENEHRPYGRRTVQIALTPEQLKAIEPRAVGERGDITRYEEILDSWLEDSAE